MISPARIAERIARLDLTPTERDAVERFHAHLHEVLREGQLRSLILYGSKARGESHRFSDIDLLVVVDDLTPEQEERIWDLAPEDNLNPDGETYLEILVNRAEQIAAMEEYGEPLLQNIEQEGILLEGEPIVVKRIDKPRLIRTELAAAKSALAAAEHLLEGGFARDVVSKSYYVYLHAARAALIAKGITPQSHSGTQKLFSLHFVKTKLVPAEFAPIYKRMQNNREDADYEPSVAFTRADAQRALARAREFLAMIEELIPTVGAAE